MRQGTAVLTVTSRLEGARASNVVRLRAGALGRRHTHRIAAQAPSGLV